MRSSIGSDWIAGLAFYTEVNVKSGVLPIGEPRPPPNLPLLGRNGGFVGRVTVSALGRSWRYSPLFVLILV